MMQRLAYAVLMVTALVASSAVAQAETRRFANPKHPTGYNLDWCFTWAAQCGQPAANAYCRNQGFERATGFAKRGNGSPTRLLGTGAICSQPGCDTFSYIDCQRAPTTVRYDAPVLNGYRVDWCFQWAEQCGQGAADAFCRAKGHARAASFNKAANVPPTRLIGTGAICAQPGCDSFQQIICQR